MTSRDLIKAARVKIQLGWAQGAPFQMRGDVPHYCLVGALNSTARDLPAVSPRRRLRLARLAATRLARLARARYPALQAKRFSDQTAVMSFNDHLWTDQAQVLALMDEAAKGK